MAVSDLIRYRLKEVVAAHKKENAMINGSTWTLKGFAAKYQINYDHLRQILIGHRNLAEKTAKKWEILIGLDEGTLTRPVSDKELPPEILPAINLLSGMDSDQIEDAIQILNVIKKR